MGNGERNGNRSQERKQEAPAEALECPGSGSCTNVPDAEECSGAAESPNPNQNSHIKHTQIESIVSKAAAGTGGLRCLQHANPAQALLALSLRGLPGHP